MGEPHVVVFPYPPQGHVKPLFAFARALASSGVAVTCVLSATNYALLLQHSDLPPSNSLLRVEAIADGDDDAALQDDPCFQHSMQKMEAGLEQFIIRSQPRVSCLISDILFPWTQDLANRRAIPRFAFCVFSATVCLLEYHISEIIGNGYLPFKPGTHDEGETLIDFIPGLLDNFKVSDLPVDFLWRDERHLEVLTRIQRNMKEAAGVVFNTVYELERKPLDALTAEGFSVYPIGPLLSMDWNHTLHHDSCLFPEDQECLSWLDNQPDASVIYAAFGSLVTLSDEEIQELALGLEASGQPFLWVIRPDAHPHLSTILSASGIMERTKDRSMLVSWAPQIAVLSHPSIAAFLTHCGYGSTLEALWMGIPMIGAFTKVSDQNVNLKLIVNWGVGVVLQEGANSPLRCSVETAINELLHGEKGRAVRQKSIELKATMRKAVSEEGCSKLTFHDLLHKLKGSHN